MGAIFEFMSRDHDRLDAIFKQFLAAPDAGQARDLFTQFDTGLRAHIVWEEEMLFPPFEEQTGMRDSGPTAVMRREHREIKQLLQTIGDAVGERAPADAVSALIDVLTEHNQKEEQILYPWLDESLSREDTSSVLAQIRQSQALGMV